MADEARSAPQTVWGPAGNVCAVSGGPRSGLTEAATAADMKLFGYNWWEMDAARTKSGMVNPNS